MQLRVLLIEDSASDAMLLELELRRGGYRPAVDRVETAAALTDALKSKTFDVVISDYSLPSFSGSQALQQVQQYDKNLPFILVSGAIGEEIAVQAIRDGASDYLLKDRLSRLPNAIKQALEQAQLRRESQRAAQEIAHSYRQAQEAIRARDQFLIIASHELKTPLTPLLLQLQGLERLASQGLSGERSAQFENNLAAAVRHVKRLAELVEQLLEVSRVDSERLQLQREHCDLVSVVAQAVDAFKEQATRAACDLELTHCASAWGMWDKFRIAQVVQNLLSNAVKFGAGKPVQVRLTCEGHPQLSVIDQGPGISAADKARIFERFERAAQLRHYGGFGLGLWIAREIVQAHNGSISVVSEANQGCTFTVDLPVGEGGGLEG
ncbi:MAG TPA: hybrid sensor histidine kinase/response regulator [Polyangiaceae bacterium]|nr:hybrid sensor histidine kinase/response regulator [Polyangiaceae bacterium]